MVSLDSHPYKLVSFILNVNRKYLWDFFQFKRCVGREKRRAEFWNCWDVTYLGMFAMLIRDIILKWNFRNGEN